MDNLIIKEILRELLVQKRMNVTELAKASGVNVQTLHNWLAVATSLEISFRLNRWLITLESLLRIFALRQLAQLQRA